MKKAAGKNNKKTMTPEQIKVEFMKLSKNKPEMDEQDLYSLFLDKFKFSGTDPMIGHIITNIMDIKKIQAATLQNFEALINHIKPTDMSDLNQSLHNKQLKDQLAQQKNYKTMYKKLFDVYTRKFTTLQFETAVQLWQVYLKGKCTFYDSLVAYLNKLIESEQKNRVHRDLWDMMYQFATTVKDVKKDYSQADGWPVFIDKLVDYLKIGKK